MQAAEELDGEWSGRRLADKRNLRVRLFALANDAEGFDLARSAEANFVDRIRRVVGQQSLREEQRGAR